ARPSFSITSSARKSSVGGTDVPSDFTVLRFMTSSSLVGNSTGRLLGFSPRRNSIVIYGSASLQIKHLHSVREQSTVGAIGTGRLNRRQAMFSYRRDGELAMKQNRQVRRKDHAGVGFMRYAFNGLLDVCGW